MNKNLVCIINHNYNDNAIILKMMFSKYYETLIIDSKSDVIEEEFDIKMENVGYSGLFNKSCELAIEKKCDGLLLICSDVSIKKKQVEQMFEKIKNLDPSEVGIYSPSSRGQSHAHCKKRGDGMREVVFIEGFIFYAFMDILKEVYPVDLNINRLGHGVDVYKGLKCIQKGKKCLVDDSIEVYHKEGTGYNINNACNQFLAYIEQDIKFKEFWELYHKSGCNSDITLKEIKKNI